jgi:hypothetical protein
LKSEKKSAEEEYNKLLQSKLTHSFEKELQEERKQLLEKIKLLEEKCQELDKASAYASNELKSMTRNMFILMSR